MIALGYLYHSVSSVVIKPCMCHLSDMTTHVMSAHQRRGALAFLGLVCPICCFNLRSGYIFGFGWFLWDNQACLLGRNYPNWPLLCYPQCFLAHC